MNSKTSTGIAALLAATFSWGGMFLVSRGVLAHLDPPWFTLARYGIAAAVVVPLMLALRGTAPLRQLRAQGADLAGRGFAGFGLFSLLLMAGLSRTEPSHAALVMATVPISTQLLRWALDGERPGRVTVAATLLALSGMLIVSGVLQNGDHGGGHWQGDALALASTLGWVWYTRGAARHAELDVLEYTGLTVLASLPLLALVAMALTLAGVARLPAADDFATVWPSLLYVGAISSAAAVLAFNFGVRSVGAVTATAFMNFVPVSAQLIGLALGRLPTGNELLGTAIVIAALLLHTSANRKTAATRRPANALAARLPVGTIVCGGETRA